MNYIDKLDFNHDRFKKYDTGLKLYKGLHYEVFDLKEYEYYTTYKQEYISRNLPQIVTDTINNLIWTEKPLVTCTDKKNQKFIDKLLKEQGLFQTFALATMIGSVQGEAVLQIRYQDKVGVVCNLVNNLNWFPLYNEYNPAEETDTHIKYFEKDLPQDKKAVLLEIHTQGAIEYQSYLKQNNKYILVPLDRYFSDIVQNLTVNEATVLSNGQYTMQTGLDVPLMYHYKNEIDPFEYYGVSDYTTSFIAKVRTINLNYNQKQSIINRNSDPLLVVPREVLQKTQKEISVEDTKAKSFGFKDANQAQLSFQKDIKYSTVRIAERLQQNMRVMGLDAGEESPKYVTWQAQLSEMTEHTKQLVDACLEETAISKVLFSPEVSTGQMSGVAIKRLAQPTIFKAEKKKQNIEKMISEILYRCMGLAVLNGTEVTTPEMPHIEFRDGLINDLQEVIDSNIKQIDAGIKSKLDAIVEINNFSQDEAELKIQAINTEQDTFLADSQTVVNG